MIRPEPKIRTRPPGVPGKAAGFSLVELLMVLAVMAILVALVVPRSPDWRAATLFNKNISNVASLLEQARQTAVTQNSYVYVGMLSADAADASVPASDRPGTVAAAFISSDGTDVLRSSGEAEAGGGVLRLLDRVQKLSSMEFEDQLPEGNALAGTLDPAAASKPGNIWKIKTRAGAAAAVTFDRVVKFTPQGAARIGDAPVEAVEIVMRPGHGGSASLSERMQAGVIRINGLTGKIDVHQPGT